MDKNFRKGVHALLVEKTGKPVWDPPTIDDVSEDVVDRMFNFPGAVGLNLT